MNDIVPFEKMQIEMAAAFGKETASQVVGFISDILRPPARELGGLLADKIRLSRWKNQVEILQKAIEHIEKLGLSKHKIPVKFLASFLDNCAWEEDENMKERWAALLANFVSKGERTNAHMSFSSILGQLSPVEAKLLDLMYDEVFWVARRAHRKVPSYQATSRIAESLNITKKEAYVISDNLIRLNLIQTNFKFKPEERDASYSKVEPTYDEISLTYMGVEFVRTCRLAFTKKHADEIEKTLRKFIDDIAKDPKGKKFNVFAQKSMKIYPHLIQADIDTGVYGALNQIIWKKGKIDDFKGYIINDSEREKIVEHCMDVITRNNQ